MDLIIFALVGVSSMVALIVAFVLCTKRQSFTIAHDYDPNYVAPSIGAKTAYRVRHVHQPIANLSIENGHSKNRDDFANKNGAKKSVPDVIANNNVKVDIVKETPATQLKTKDGRASASIPSHPAKDSVKQLSGNEVQRTPSKRKAPTVPAGSTSSGGSTPSGASSPAKPKSVTSPAVSVTTPTRSGTTSPKASTSQGQKVAKGNPQRQSKKTAAPAPKQSPTKVASPSKKELPPTKTSPKAASSVKDAPSNSDTSSLPRATKTTPSPERVRYVKKPSTLPGRNSKRPAPVAPGQAQQVILTVPNTEIDTVPSSKDTIKTDNVNSKPTVAPGQTPTEDVTTGSDVSDVMEKANRSSRRALDRLPSLPKEKPLDSGLNVTQSDITAVPNGSDSIDGPDDIIAKDSSEEDPYSVIKNRKMSKESVEHLKIVDNDESKYASSVANGAVEDSVSPTIGDQNGEETPVLKENGVILEPTIPDDMTDGSPTEAVVKGEPPYAKVIKRNKRNRANVRVRFTSEHPEEIKPKKPPTPGALVSMMGEGQDEVQFDDIMTIPEGTSYD